jgi:hypothetical protein
MNHLRATSEEFAADGYTQPLTATRRLSATARDAASVKPWRLLLSNSVGTCQNGREVHSKRRVHCRRKDYKRGSHYKRQEIVNGHVGPSRLFEILDGILTPAREPRCDKCHC